MIKKLHRQKIPLQDSSHMSDKGKKKFIKAMCWLIGFLTVVIWYQIIWFIK